MKKVLLIVARIALLITIGGLVTYTILNREKESISAEEFKSIMENKGYTIVDATSQFAQYRYVQKVYIAITNDRKYQIEFYTLSNDEGAIYFYNTNKTILENSKQGTTSETNAEFKNYCKYTLNNNGKYKAISRINNSVIYLNVEEQYKDSVKDLLKEIGY